MPEEIDLSAPFQYSSGPKVLGQTLPDPPNEQLTFQDVNYVMGVLNALRLAVLELQAGTTPPVSGLVSPTVSPTV